MGNKFIRSMRQEKFLWLGFLFLIALVGFIVLRGSGTSYQPHIAELGILFIIGLFLSHPPLTPEQFSLSDKAFVNKFKKKEIHLTLLYIKFFLLFCFMLYIYLFDRIHNWQVVGFIGVILLVSMGVLQVIKNIARKIRSKQKLFYLLIGILLVAAVGLLYFDFFLYVIFVLILVHWYAYTQKDITTQNISRNLKIFLTSFFQAGFLFLFIRYMEETYRFAYNMPIENTVSYVLLVLGLTAILYNHLIGTKFVLKYHYGVISETQYYSKLYPLFVFDANYSKFERMIRRIIFFQSLIIFLLILLFSLYRIESFLLG